ncbi:hypothetical protein DH2020_031866 [Rehmannia glutinosa]|uniref:ALOG domain-containing protein n=1 Tax=Rehmannia glutinosa TaxID=99300 RepID=A0ABR0VHJ8_REHGL
MDKNFSEGSSSGGGDPATPSRYESQKRRDWNTFGQFLKNQRPPMGLAHCNSNHPEPPAPCTCPLRQAWGSLDALIGRLRAAYEENGGSPETNPFASGAIRIYLKEVKECQAKARGIPYSKKKKTSGHGNTTHDRDDQSNSSSSMPFS